MSEPEVVGISLSGLKGGAVEERVQRKLAEIFANIRDPNTPRKFQRKLTLELVFAEISEDRAWAGVKARVLAKLAPDRPVTTFFLFGEEDGVVTATEPVAAKDDEKDPRQRELAVVAGGAGATVESINRGKGRKPKKEETP